LQPAEEPQKKELKEEEPQKDLTAKQNAENSSTTNPDDQNK
jgi:hypothetical protein